MRIIRTLAPIINRLPERIIRYIGSKASENLGFLLLARLSKADIVPIALEGTEQLLPISQNDMGKETIHHATVRVKIGQPFQIEEKHQNCDNREEECIQTAMRKIAEMLKPEYQGVYKTD